MVDRSLQTPSPPELSSRLESHPGLRPVVEEAAEHRLQIVLGWVEKGPDGSVVLRQEGYRLGAEYFYPASTVKLFAAVAAAQRLDELASETGWPIDLGTALVIHPLFPDDELEDGDPDNLDGGTITVRHAIREIFLVSDNQAYNHLYELAGPDGIAASLAAVGLGDVRVVHRLSEFRSPAEHYRLPRIDLVGDGFRYTLPVREATPLPPLPEVPGLEVGKGFLRGGERIEGPMDFRPKNRVPLADLQRGLCKVVRPDVDCGGPAFELRPEVRAEIVDSMSRLPGDSENPRYERTEYPDHYVKGLLTGLVRVAPAERWRIYNKTGRAYGFSTENAWVVDVATGRGVFVAATLYTNPNGVLNDDDYAYDEVADPFFADLGQWVGRELLP